MTAIPMDDLDQLAAKAFEGYLVRKDLVRKYARTYPVPTYVVEFLLGRYCASTDPKEILWIQPVPVAGDSSRVNQEVRDHRRGLEQAIREPWP